MMNETPTAASSSAVLPAERGLMIAFLGTDGSGKSTIIDALPRALGILNTPKGAISSSIGNTPA